MRNEKVVWAAQYGDCLWWLRDDNASGIEIDSSLQRYSLFRKEDYHYGREHVFAISYNKFNTKLAWARIQAWSYISGWVL